MLSDVDSGGLSSAQQQALSDWVTMGGHLIVTGGQNWQATAAGVSSLLPLEPSASRDIDSLRPLAAWLRDSAALDTQTIIATGTLSADAQVLAAAEDGTPLLARRTLGAGEVDYLAAEPNNAPCAVEQPADALAGAGDHRRTAARLGQRLRRLGVGGTRGEILPGYDPLPDILPLFAFLLLYILLIGPLNYIPQPHQPPGMGVVHHSRLHPAVQRAGVWAGLQPARQYRHAQPRRRCANVARQRPRAGR